VRGANRSIDIGGGAPWNERPRFCTEWIVGFEMAA
jgi:hypothetical protein